MASNLHETVAMNFYPGKILLYIINYCTQLSASTVISNKNPDIIIKIISKIWTSVYGSAKKFATAGHILAVSCIQ